MNDQQQSRADALTDAQIRSFAESACDHEVGAGALRQNVATVGNVILAIRNALKLAAASPVEQPAAAPIDKVTCARMGHGVVSIGECFSPELEEPGIICMELPEQRGIGLDTGDVFPKGLRPPADKILAYISFANPAAIDQMIGVLQRIKATHFSASSPADERAALPQIPDLVKATAWLTMCLRTELSRLDDDTHKALDEVEAQLSCVRAITNGAIDYEAMVAARAAASPAAEGETEDHECVYENGDGVCRQCAELAKHHRAAASPAAERVTAALQALSADVHTLGDGWANDEAMIGLAKKYLRVEPKPASPELSLWRDFVLLAVTDAAPQPAQADAPAHAAECPHCDGEGVIEGDSGTSPCACQRDAQEGMPTFGARRAQADAPAEARERDDPELIAASNKGYAAGLRDGKALGACGPLAPADAGEAAAWRYRTSGDNWCYCDGDPVHVCDRDYEKQPLYTAPPAARVASLTDEQRESIEHAATWLARSEDLQNKAHAKRLCDLLNGMDHDR